MQGVVFALLLLGVAFATQQAPSEFQVRFTFDLPPPKNSVVFNVTRAWAPIGVDRFYALNTLPTNYYNNNSMFRVLPGFVVQFGISSIPSVAQQWENANIQDDPVLKSNVVGTLTYATAGPNTRTTQLFVNFADNSFLDGQGFAPFAVIADMTQMQVLQRLYSGYGEGPSNNQATIYQQGWAYLQANWPRLNNLIKAEIVNH